ncbi:hypothetical protein CHUAL_003709 [Chamberlinius hualienensis]
MHALPWLAGQILIIAVCNIKPSTALNYTNMPVSIERPYFSSVQNVTGGTFINWPHPNLDHPQANSQHTHKTLSDYSKFWSSWKTEYQILVGVSATILIAGGICAFVKLKKISKASKNSFDQTHLIV